MPFCYRFGLPGLVLRLVLEPVGGLGRPGVPLWGVPEALGGASGGPWRAILLVDRHGPGPGLPPGEAPGPYLDPPGATPDALPPSKSVLARLRGDIFRPTSGLEVALCSPRPLSQGAGVVKNVGKPLEH